MNLKNLIRELSSGFLVLSALSASAAVSYWTGNGASNERGKLMSDAANWTLDPTSNIMAFRYIATMSLDADMTNNQKFTFQNDDADITFDFYPHTLKVSGTNKYVAQNAVGRLKSGTMDLYKLSFAETGDSDGAISGGRFFVEGNESSISLSGGLTLNCGSNNLFSVSGGGLAAMPSLGIGCLAGYATQSNAFSVSGVGSTFRYTAANGTLGLFTSSGATADRFEIDGASVEGVTALTLGAGNSNAVILKNADFVGGAPSLAITGGRGQVVELADQRFSYRTLSNPIQFGACTDSFIRLTGATDVDITSASNWKVFDDNSRGNTLEVLDGAKLSRTNSNKQVTCANASGNTIRISGSGSEIRYDGAVLVGDYGHSNRLIVEDGGSLFDCHHPGCGGGNVFVGQHNGMSNLVMVCSKGQITTKGRFIIGAESNAAYDKCVITSGGSISASGGLLIGWYNDDQTNLTHSAHNALEVSDGGTVTLAGSSGIFSMAGEDQTLVLSNGSITVGASAGIPDASKFEAANATNMHVHVAGTNSFLAAETDIRIARGTDFTINLGSDAVVGPIFRAKRNIRFEGVGELHLKGCENVSSDVRIVLAEAEGSLSVDQDSLESLNRDLPKKFRVRVKGQQLLLESRKGLLLIFR